MHIPIAAFVFQHPAAQARIGIESYSDFPYLVDSGIMKFLQNFSEFLCLFSAFDLLQNAVLSLRRNRFPTDSYFRMGYASIHTDRRVGRKGYSSCCALDSRRRRKLTFAGTHPILRRNLVALDACSVIRSVVGY